MTYLKTILTGTALATLTAGSALAEAHTMNADNLIRSRDITGGNVYSLSEGEAFGDSMMYDAMGDNWNNIGEIEDLVLDTEGQIIGIVAEVGGFLDIGDKHVVIPVDNLRLTAVDDATYGYVTDYTEEQLEELEGVDEGFWN